MMEHMESSIAKNAIDRESQTSDQEEISQGNHLMNSRKHARKGVFLFDIIRAM